MLSSVVTYLPASFRKHRRRTLRSSVRASSILGPRNSRVLSILCTNAQTVPPQQCVENLTKLLKPRGWVQLMAAGLVDVREEIVPIPQGKSCASGDIAKISTEGFVQSVSTVCEACKGLGLDLPADFLDDLPAEYGKSWRRMVERLSTYCSNRETTSNGGGFKCLTMLFVFPLIPRQSQQTCLQPLAFAALLLQRC